MAQRPIGLSILTRKLIAHLKQIGVPDAAIRTMIVNHPRRFFGGA